MTKAKLTAGRIAGFQCPEGKLQAFLWCAEVQGLAVRATSGSTRKRYVFESKVKFPQAALALAPFCVSYAVSEITLWLSYLDGFRHDFHIQVFIEDQ